MQVLSVLGAVCGAVLVLVTSASVVVTLVVPRGQSSRFAKAVDRAVHGAFHAIAHRLPTYEARDRLLGPQAPVMLLVLLAGWLACYCLGYGLLLWPLIGRGLGVAVREAASSMATLGFASTAGNGPTVVDVVAGITGMVLVALQIAYLPTLYGAFNRRETEVTLLGGRAGVPAWGPELLARTRFGITTEDLPALFTSWERWAADVSESHVSYPVLIRFRSPRPLSSWLVSLLAVMDAAALFLALCPSQAPVEARLCLRMGFTCLRDIADAVGIAYDPDPRPDEALDLSYDDFLAAVERLDAVGFERERSAEEAWAHFTGWRVNYEQVAYDLARTIDAVPALWSGPRRHSDEVILTVRPPNRLPGAPDERRGKVPMRPPAGT